MGAKKRVTIEDLEKRERDAENKLRRARLAIEGVRVAEELPALEKKYVGKFWKYDNGVDRDRRWWIYSYCRAIEAGSMRGHEEVILDTFEMDYRGVNSFRIHSKENTFLCQVEITPEEYVKAFKKFKRRCDALTLPPIKETP